ncbi:divalent-cation tolerance protein CutA [Shewanella cyperi]|uniref:Divalent-cation tolerance protein CutA n=1 Tax=Shewanella cyperi TaxID=2814292 RepID=A0A975AJS7_9GAMM|nr:divalent-cation tolerance protein CutA [Shewanella cyperi]QSX29622.1 divalent-cation tolerance protein CutA [Shewanella cyperi]
MQDQYALLVLTTCPDKDTAVSIADVLVQEGLAACVQISAPVQSVYRWQGKVCIETEVQLFIKCHTSGYDALQQRLLSLHPYELPEIIALKLDRGLPGYLDWIKETTHP